METVMTTPSCPHTGCTTPATKTFLNKAFCPKHHAVEVEVNRFQFSQTDGVLSPDGMYLVNLTDDMVKDPRVQKRMEELSTEREKRREAARKALAGGLTDEQRKVRAARIAYNLSANDDVRLEQMRRLAREDTQLFPFVMDAWYDLYEAARLRAGRAPTKLWDELAAAVPTVSRPILKRFIFGTIYNYPDGPLLANGELQALKNFFDHNPRASGIDGYFATELKAFKERLDQHLDDIAKRAQGAVAKSPVDEIAEEEDRKFLAAAKAAVGSIAAVGAAAATLDLPKFPSPAAPTAAEKDQSDMANTQSFGTRLIERAKETGADIGYRTSARQLAKMVRDPLVKGIAQRLGRNSRDRARYAEQIGAFLDTEAGFGVLQGLVGLAMLTLPTDNEYVELIGQESLTAGGTAVTDTLADMVMNPLREALTALISGLPKGQVRVDLSDDAKRAKRRAELEAELAEIERAETGALSKTAG